MPTEQPRSSTTALARVDDERRAAAFENLDALKFHLRVRAALRPVTFGLTATATLVVFEQPLLLVIVGGAVGGVVGLVASLLLEPKNVDKLEQNVESSILADSGVEGEKRRRIANTISSRKR